MKMIINSLIYLPSPSNLNYFWNFGSLLGICLSIQLISGILVRIHYVSDVTLAFERVRHLMRDVPYGWLFRRLHANGASLFFIMLYLHVFRGIIIGSYKLVLVWSIGVVILLLVMATAFLGYVLPWGQMSFWGATVITNLFSALPFIGERVVTWLWGGFAVDKPTLTRFFSFHFLLPFIVRALVGVHLLFLHDCGSRNPLGVKSEVEKLKFHPYYSYKDLLGALLVLGLFLGVRFYLPWRLGDPENFIPANALVTPIHIQPEWYFLFAYAILRSIPNKLGGVVALALSVLILLVLPHFSRTKFFSRKRNPKIKTIFWVFGACVFLLTWIGARPVEDPYILVGQILTLVYFFLIFLMRMISASNY